MVNTIQLLHIQSGIAVGVLAVLWLLETLLPFFTDRPHRLRHALRNLMIGGINLIVMAVAFAGAMAGVSAWAEQRHFGLLNRLSLPVWAALPLALVLFDAWMYIWHRG